MTVHGSKSAAPVANTAETNPEQRAKVLTYTDFSKSPIVRATWTPLEPGVRALLNALGAQHEDHEEHSSVMAEVAAIEHTHPYIRTSERLHVNTSNIWNADRGIFVFHFGAYGDTHVLAFGSLEDALEDAAETLKEIAPGYFCDDQVEEAYREAYESAIAAGKSEDDAREAGWSASDEDTTYTESGYLLSHEWGVSELDSLDDVVPFVLGGV